MALTPPPAAHTAPPATPQRGVAATFSTRFDAFVVWLVAFWTWLGTYRTWQVTNGTELDALQTDVAAKQSTASTAATTATTQAGIATTQAGTATTQAAAAAASAASAAAIAGAFVGTSTTSLLISNVPKTLTTQTGEQYTGGVFLSLVSAANNANWMFGQLTSYNTATGAMVFAAQSSSGSGTFADWNISLVGAPGPPGAGVTPQAVGFTLAGGASSKNLTVDEDMTASQVGFRTIPQNSQSTAYTAVLADSGKHLLHPSADTTARTFTIPANASVAYPIGTAITFVNQASAGVMTIAITTDTMRLAGAGTTGSRTLAANGVATAIKLTATEWIISGMGLT